MEDAVVVGDDSLAMQVNNAGILAANGDSPLEGAPPALLPGSWSCSRRLQRVLGQQLGGFQTDCVLSPEACVMMVTCSPSYLPSSLLEASSGIDPLRSRAVGRGFRGSTFL